MKTESLTFTRFIAAFCVLVFHLGYDVFPFNLYLVKNFFRHSNIFVSYFFFLSGFVMIIAYDKHIKTNQFNKSLYWIKRIARIYPLYFIALLLYTCIAILALDYKLDTGHLILNLFLLQSWTEKTALTLNFPGWSLSVEFLFYALFPLLIKLINTVNLSRNLVTFSLIWIVSQVVTICYPSIKYNPLIHLNTFLGGLLLAKFLIEKPEKAEQLKSYSKLILITSTSLFILIMNSNNFIIKSSHNGLLTPIFGLIVVGLIFSDIKIIQVFSKPLFIKLGEISYSIYILHMPIIYIVRYSNNHCNKIFYSNTIAEFYWTLFILLIICFFLYRYIELPIKRQIVKIYKK